MVRCYLVQVIPQGNLAGDQLMGQVVILLLQSHTCLLKASVFPLYKDTEGRLMY